MTDGAIGRGPVLVTGASGFIGRHLVNALLGAERRVKALCRQPWHLDDLRHPLLEVVAGDLEHPPSYAPHLAGAATVFHLAAVRGAPGTRADAMRRVNVDATAALARAAMAGGVGRFVHVCTATIFGPSGAEPVSEAAGYGAAAPATSYMASRAQGLAALNALAADGLPLLTACPTVVFGPDHRTHQNRVTRLARFTLCWGADVVIAGGGQRRTLAYVDDVVRGLCLAERLGRIGEAYILGGDDLSHRAFNRLVLALGGRRPRVRLSIPRGLALAAARAVDAVRRYEPGSGLAAAVRVLTREWRYSSAKAERDLGYTRTPARQGLERTLGASTDHPREHH